MSDFNTENKYKHKIIGLNYKGRVTPDKVRNNTHASFNSEIQ